MFKSIAQLEAYYWVARLGSFQAAADRLGLTPPSISIRIKELEQDVGTRLFSRDGRGARLTEQGHLMFDPVENIISQLGDLGSHFGEVRTLHGLFRIGVPDSFASCGMSPFMRLLEERYPELNVSVSVNNSRSLARKLEESALDIALLANPKVSSAYHKDLLGDQTLIWVASPTISPALQDITPETLAHQRIITNPLPSPIYTALTNWFAHHNLVPTHISTVDHVKTIAALTLDGRGVSIVPECIVQKELAAGTLLALDIEPVLPRQKMFVVYPKKAINRGIKEVVHLMHEAIEGTGFLAES